MRITRIDFEGEFGNFATATRKRDSQYIKVTIFIPGTPDGRRHHVLADNEEDVYSMAECLQNQLDFCHGNRAKIMIHDYYRELLKLSDC